MKSHRRAFERFTPARSLSFTVSLTANVDPGVTPDVEKVISMSEQVPGIPQLPETERSPSL